MNEKRHRDELIVKRNLLFTRFCQSPKDIRLALEIKIIDDHVAESTERIRTRERSVELREQNNARLLESSSGTEQRSKPLHRSSSKPLVRR
jgi:hypothetical protein